MFYSFDHESIRYTGRWYKGTATACGSYFEIFFKGDSIDLQFDTVWNREPAPHIYLQADQGVMSESVISPYLRLSLPYGEHTLRVIYKSAVEDQHRWYQPLEGKVAFKGYSAEQALNAPKDERKIIEFVGDSITEGVEADLDNRITNDDPQPNRPFQDDATATYAWRIAEHFDLAPIIMGYGAVGVSCSGCGSVPAAPKAYPYCFNNAPIPDVHPDYVFINHGSNDHFVNKEEYEAIYKELLDVIRTHHPEAKIICINPFAGYHKESFPCVVEDYNCEHGTDVVYINTRDWAKGMTVHPSREGHKILAEHLITELESIIKK